VFTGSVNITGSNTTIGTASFQTSGNNGVINLGGNTFYGQVKVDSTLGGIQINSIWGGANSGIIQLTNGTAGNVRLHIADNGNIGIGTVTPGQLFEVVGGEIKAGRVDSTNEGGQVSFGRSTDNATAWYIDAYGNVASPQLRFVNVTNAVVAMTITGSNVGIGTSSPGRKLVVVGGNGNQLELDNTGQTYTQQFFKINGTEVGTFYASNTEFGMYTYGSQLISFSTNNTERMRITSDGRFLVRTTSVLNPGGVGGVSNMANPDDNGLWALALQNNATTNTYGRGLGIRFTTDFNNSSNEVLWFVGNTTPRFFVTSDGGVRNYSANNSNLSDIRVKKDIIALESYWNKFKEIEIVKFKYKDQTHDDFNIGVIAQQVEEIAPEFVNVDGFGGAENIPEDGIPLKSVYEADLHHATIKVLQEAMAKIETLEAKVQYLENK
jgi:hypothetical protein